MLQRKRLTGAVFVLIGLGALVVFGATQVLSQTSGPLSEEENRREFERLENAPNVVDPTAVAQHIEEYEAAVESAYVDFTKWLEAFNNSGVDPRTLEQIEYSAEYMEGHASLDEALEEADLVVHGRISSVEFRPSPVTTETYARSVSIVTVVLSDVLKGDASEEISLVFIGGPASAVRDPSTTVLRYFATQPLLFEGDEALLVLKSVEDHPSYGEHFPGHFQPLGWAGINKVVDGRLQTTEHGVFKDRFDGRPLEEVIDVLRTELGD